ncbi:tyrosine-type recombinase/integrase [Chloroflexota bacterium]
MLDGIRGKKSHKKKIDRDVLLVETARMTGLRRGELSNLEVEDLHLDIYAPVLIVRGGKGAKDRSVSLNQHIRDQLATFTKGKSPQENVFNLAPKTISMKIGYWARKSGVPHLHTHSLRHYVGTTLFQKHANQRAVQAVLGHESLETTMRYAHVIEQDTIETMKLLDAEAEDKPDTETQKTIEAIRKRQVII